MAVGQSHACRTRCARLGYAGVVLMSADPQDEGFTRKHKAKVIQHPVSAEAPSDFRLTDTGAMKPISYNLLQALETHPELVDCLGWDQLSDKPVWRNKPPFLGAHRTEIHDQDASELAFWGTQTFYADFKSSSAMEAMEVCAKRHPFHPVINYLDGLHWDGISRLDSFLSDAFGVEQTPYHAAIGRSFLIGAVARVMRPGCQMDTMLVLMGLTGIGKTSAVRALLPDFSWYAETTESPASKDFFQALRGKWIVEIGELHSFRNADWSKIKQMLSAKMDTYRPSYGRFAKDYPRQCVFIGTTEDDTWNRDAGGARRFWPVRCRESNTGYILAQRDQLWAEAVELFRGGASWWEIPEADDELESVYESDEWEHVIRAWMMTHGPGPFTGHTLLTEALGIETGRYTTGDQKRLGPAARKAGMKHVRIMMDSRRVWAWMPKLT